MNFLYIKQKNKQRKKNFSRRLSSIANRDLSGIFTGCDDAVPPTSGCFTFADWPMPSLMA
ncbi:hypothetical protein Hanom_Chr10g00877931 [Helianthus anomalus]